MLAETATESLARWCCWSDSNTRPTDYESVSYQRRVLLIKHLRRLPISKPVSPRHSYGTPNVDWSQLDTSREFRASSGSPNRAKIMGTGLRFFRCPERL